MFLYFSATLRPCFAVFAQFAFAASLRLKTPIKLSDLFQHIVGDGQILDGIADRFKYGDLIFGASPFF